MNAHFSMNTRNSIVSTAKATIYVVIKRSKFQHFPPEFLHVPYEFSISENLKPNDLARNVTIVVKEPHNLSVYNSGFNLELLNADLSFADDVFEIVPNYGEGLVVSTLKLRANAKLDYEHGRREYNLVVRATSRSARNLISFTNLTLHVQDSNEFSPYFNSSLQEIILNEPENYVIGDAIYKLKAYDIDGDGLGHDLVYKVVGPFNDQLVLRFLCYRIKMKKCAVNALIRYC